MKFSLCGIILNSVLVPGWASDLLITKVGTRSRTCFPRREISCFLFFGICFASSSGFLHPASLPSCSHRASLLVLTGSCLCDGVSASLKGVCG